MSQDTELALRAGAMPPESAASGRHGAELRVQQCAVTAERTGTGRKREHFAVKLLFQAPPPPINAKDSLRVGNTQSDGPKSALGRREPHDARPEREGGPQAPALLSRALKRVSKGPAQKVLSEVLHKTHLKKAR